MRLLNYIRDDEAVDAITFIPQNPISFAGFSVYPVHTPELEYFKCIYRYKIGSKNYPESTQEFSQNDVVEKMCDVIFDQEIQVEASTPITIMVRFIGPTEDDFFCGTLLGYGGENYKEIENEEREAFEIRQSDDCTKGETDERFG